VAAVLWHVPGAPPGAVQAAPALQSAPPILLVHGLIRNPAFCNKPGKPVSLAHDPAALNSLAVVIVSPAAATSRTSEEEKATRTPFGLLRLNMAEVYRRSSQGSSPFLPILALPQYSPWGGSSNEYAQSKTRVGRRPNQHSIHLALGRLQSTDLMVWTRPGDERCVAPRQLCFPGESHIGFKQGRAG